MAWCLSCDKRNERMHSNRYTLKDPHNDTSAFGDKTKNIKSDGKCNISKKTQHTLSCITWNYIMSNSSPEISIVNKEAYPITL